MQAKCTDAKLTIGLCFVSFYCVAAAFRGRAIEMGVVTESGTANQSYANAGPLAVGSRRNIKFQGNTSHDKTNKEQTADSRAFTIHLSITFPKPGADADAAARQAPYPVVVFINGFQASFPIEF